MEGKNLQIGLLLDYYGEMLTGKQREALDLYYNEDLSLAEISENLNITRQGVHDLIKRSESTLLEMEDKLGLVARLTKIDRELDNIAATVSAMSNLNLKRLFSKELAQMLDYLKDSIKSISSSQ